jgi:hypothetical protein
MRNRIAILLCAFLAGCGGAGNADRSARSAAPGAGPDTRAGASGVLQGASRREFGSGACEDTVAVAEEAGLDYTADLDKAIHGDGQALRRLLVFTTYESLDAASSQGHAATLGELIRNLGDKAFAKALEDQPPSVRGSVGDSIRYDLGLDDEPDVAKASREFQTTYPQTARLALQPGAQPRK